LVPDTISREIGIHAPPAVAWPTVTEAVKGFSTLVVITLIPEGAGTKLRVVESGFSDLAWPEHERARYADENPKGWIVELDELRTYAAQATALRGER
jgi:hypothetical protein